MISQRRLLLTVTLVLLASPLGFGQAKFDQAEYLRGAAAGQKKGEAVKGSLSFDEAKKEVLFLDAKNEPVLSIPYTSIRGMLYEQTAKPRYTAGLLISPWFFLTKSKKHYLTFQYGDAGGAGQYAIVHLDKSNFQQALATAEAQTGEKVDRFQEK